MGTASGCEQEGLHDLLWAWANSMLCCHRVIYIWVAGQGRETSRGTASYDVFDLHGTDAICCDKNNPFDLVRRRRPSLSLQGETPKRFWLEESQETLAKSLRDAVPTDRVEENHTCV